MNLIYDIGNTRTKVSEVGAGPLRAAIVCAVGEVSDELRHQIDALPCPVLWFAHNTPVPNVRLAYATPQTLGMDRLAAAVGAARLAPGRDILIVDAGTCATMDLVTADGTFHGGVICPGVEMRLRAMHNHTVRLPMVGLSGDAPLVGYDTDTALRSGALRGLAHEVNGLAAELREAYPELLVYLTGGNARDLEKWIKGAIFADESLVACGLNAILDHNV